ncbi:MAG TPA: glycosyltransferase [Caldithrix abyssi]|uniref:Glycosyltransferase n=1 Tax=Caldithrix abyssi TaxID=187145 RepID=A0A7V4TYH5_CALAY|nr:glycosyltransferase [Caldithrix abyssi]
MKIALVNSYYNPDVIGGAEIIVELLAKGLSEKGHEVKVFCSSPSILDESQDKIHIHRDKIANIYWPPAMVSPGSIQKGIWHLLNLYNPFSAKRIVCYIKEFAPDIIHLHNISIFTSALYSELQKHFSETPIVQTLHDYWHACIKNTLLHGNGDICVNRPGLCSLRSSFIIDKAQVIKKFVSPSLFLKEYYIKESLISKQRIEVIPNALPRLVNKKEQIKEKNQKISFVYIGQLETHKGINVLLEAIRRVKKHSKIEFIFAGKGRLENLVKKEAHIKYLGYISGQEKERILSSGDVLFLPSQWYENYPLVGIEACNHGMAIIGSRIGGIPEIVTDGWNGKLLEPGNANQLTIAIESVTRNDSLLRKWQQNSLKFAEKFNLDTMIDRYLALYRSL